VVFEKLREALREMKSDLAVSECHGALCGLLSSSASFSRNKWFDHITGTSAQGKSYGRCFEVLEEIETITIGAFSDSEFSFDLLLVDDESELRDRLESFVFWCKGYLSGFGLGDIVDLKHLGEDSQGFLKDLERFCLIDCNDKKLDIEEGERYFIEIVEYTRVGVMLLNLETNATLHAKTIRDN
jgi:uncharacterized protein YgfB (UPF0149 family)